MPLKPWRDRITPHRNVLEGSFQESEFAADLNKVARGGIADLPGAGSRCWTAMP